MLRIERYDAARHYDIVASWWRARGAQILPADVLPPTGAIAMFDGAPVASCFVWLTNARMAYMAMPSTAPETSPKSAWLAIDGVIRLCIAIAKEAGCRCVWAAAENRGIDRIVERIGMTRASPLNNYFLLLDPSVSSDMLTD